MIHVILFVLAMTGTGEPDSPCDVLIKASARRDIAALRGLLGQVSVDCANPYHHTALAVAARRGHADVVELLLGHGAKVRVDEDSRSDAMYTALTCCHIDCARLLLKADPDGLDRFRLGPTARMLITGDDRLSDLVDRQLDSERDAFDRSAVHWVAAAGRTDLLKELISNGADLAGRDDRHWDALLWATCRGSVESVRMLLDAGCPVRPAEEERVEHRELAAALHKDRISLRPTRPLTLAAEMGREGVAKLLMSRGEDPKLNIGWSTPLLTCIGNGNVEGAARVLRWGGSAINEGTTQRCTWPMQFAALADNPAFIPLLKRHGADVEVRDESTSTPLMTACRRKDAHAEAIVAALLAAGARIDAVDGRKCQPLHGAAEHGCAEVIAKLVERGAKWDVKDVTGRTPWRILEARARKDAAFKASLEKAGILPVAEEQQETDVEVEIERGE